MCTSEKAPGITSPVRRPLFYYITDRHQLPSGSLSALQSKIRRVISWGVDFVQLREKDLSDRDLLRLTQGAMQCARGSRCKILVNSRVDIAVAGGADGVHLPCSGLEVLNWKSKLPPDLIFGASAHSLREARRAAAAGAHYILLGPVFPTPSKMSYGEPLGLSRFRQVCSALRLTVFGLGGIRPENIRAVMNAGASGIAGIRLFQSDLSELASNTRYSRAGGLKDQQSR